MIKLKKLIGTVLLTAIFAQTLPAAVSANTDSDLLYFNDFESYTGGAFAETVTSGQGWTSIGTVKNLSATKTDDGNTWLDPTGSSTWKFSMGDTRMETGKLHISYDVIVDGVETGSAAVYFTYTNSSETTVSRYLFIERTSVTTSNSFVYRPSFSNASSKNTAIMDYTPGASYKIDIIYDADDKSAKVAIDGGNITEITSSGTTARPVETIIFTNYADVKYDNLKIQKYDDETFYAKEAWTEHGKVAVKFSETIKAGLTADGIALKNVSDGSEIAVTGMEYTDTDEIALTYEGEPTANEEYTIVFPDTFTDVIDNTVNKSVNLVLKTATESEENNSAEDSFLLNWDFEDYNGGTLVNYGWKRSQGSSSDKKAGEFGGSKTMHIASGGSGGVNVYTFSEPVKSDIYYASIDFGFDAVAEKPFYMGFFQEGGYTTTSDTSKTIRTLWSNAETADDESLTMYIGASEFSTNIANIKGKTYFSPDKLHRAAFSYDFNTRLMRWFADGKEIHSKTISDGTISSVGSFSFYTTGGGHADNVKAQKYDPTTFVVQKAQASDNEITVTFSNDLNPDTVGADAITLKNLYDGSEIQVTDVEQTDYNKIVLTYSGNVTANDEYTIVFPDTFTDVLGSPVYESAVLNLKLAANAMALQKVSFTDYYGEKYNVTDKVFTVLDNITLTFSNAVNASSAASRISMASEDGTAFSDYSVSVSGNNVILTVERPLFANTNYTISVSGVTNSDATLTSGDYEVEFTTGEDATILGMVDANGKEFTFGEATVGDYAYLNARILNSDSEAKSYRLMIAKYNDKRLSEVGHKCVEIPAGEFYEINHATDDKIYVTKDNLFETTYKVFAWDADTYEPYVDSRIYYNGEKTGVLYNNEILTAPEGEPYAVNIGGEEYVSVDFLASKAGYTVSENENEVVLTRGSDKVTLTEGDFCADVNGEGTLLYNAPIEREGNFYITAASVGEILPIAEDLTPYEGGVALHKKYYDEDDTFFHLTTTFIGDPQTQRGFSWQAMPEYDDMVIEYSAGESLVNPTQKSASYELEPIVYNFEGTDPAAYISYFENMLFYKVGLTNLEPGTTYSYRIGDKTADIWSEVYTFTTEAENTDSFSMIAVTDSHVSVQPTYSAYYTNTLTKALADSPNAAFIANMGDLINNYGMSDDEWDDYYYATKGISEGLPTVSVVGNHETRALGTKYYNLRFMNPQNGTGLVPADYDYTAVDKHSKAIIEELDNTVYSFDYGNAHFAVLNSGTDYGTGPSAPIALQTEWLKKDLNASDKKWKIVMVHIPVYVKSGDTTHSLYEIMDECGVDLVLSGHTHHYVRSKPMKADAAYTGEYDASSVSTANGTIYSILGHAGMKGASSDAPAVDWADVSTVTEGKNPSYNILTFDNEKISFTAKDYNGNVLDEYIITK